MSDLLSKFDAVSVSADSRISSSDRMFCEQNQAAYEAAILAYQGFSCYWAEMEQEQETLKKDIASRYKHDYLHSTNGPKISDSLIRKHIHALHADFIHVITSYFCNQYKITVSESEIVDVLVPKEPEYWPGGDNSEHDAYLQTMRDMRIRYSEVVEQIMLRLDGRGLTEQAFYELRRKCQEAAYWANGTHDPRFERKKDVIRLKELFCKKRGWPHDDWEIYDNTQDLIRGLAHFETGAYDSFPDGLSQMLGWRGPKTDTLDFPSCVKLKQIKLFKNGRMDVRFTSAAYAEEFVAKYLATE